MSAVDYIPPSMVTGSITGAAASVGGSHASEAVQSMGLESKAAAEKRLAEEEAANKRWTAIVAGIASGAVAMGLLAMYIEASLVATIAFVFPLFTAPYSVVQRRKLNKLPTLTHEINCIRGEVNRLQRENNNLTLNINSLEKQVSKLSDLESTLEQHVKDQGQDVSQFRALVKENGEIVRKQKQLQETQVMQNLLTAIMKSDGDNDFHICDEELEMLIFRLKNIEGVAVDEQLIRRQFRASVSNSMATLFEITKVMVEREERIGDEV